jgi:DNA-directed RNA polymerase specialized sigma24 family protein
MVDDRDTDTPEVEFLDHEQKGILNQLFDQLKVKCKEVLLFWGQGYAMAEIAEQLEFSSSQVAMNKKNKCLKELHGLMDEDPLVIQLLKELNRA